MNLPVAYLVSSPNARSVKIVLRSVKSQGKVREFFPDRVATLFWRSIEMPQPCRKTGRSKSIHQVSKSFKLRYALNSLCLNCFHQSFYGLGHFDEMPKV